MKKKKRTKDILIDGKWYCKEPAQWEREVEPKIEITNIWNNNSSNQDETWLFTDDRGWLKSYFNGLEYVDSNNQIIPYARIISKLNYRPAFVIKLSEVFLKEVYED